MWVKLNVDAGFVADGFERPGSYFRLEDITYLRVFGPSHVTGLWYVTGKAMSSNIEVALDPGFDSQESAQEALDTLMVSSEGVVDLAAGAAAAKST